MPFALRTEEIPRIPERRSREPWRRVEIRVSSEIWMAIMRTKSTAIRSIRSNGDVEEESTAGGSL